jgi:hypothetical protein
MTTNIIEEIYPGHFLMILDFPDKSELINIVSPAYKYVWLFEQQENRVVWDEYRHRLFDGFHDKEIKVRNITMEVLVKTEDFIDLIPSISQGVKMIQTNIEPPYYLALDRLKGKERFDLLKSKVDYLFELDMPGAIDYSPIISPNREYLEKLSEKIAVRQINGS